MTHTRRISFAARHVMTFHKTPLGSVRLYQLDTTDADGAFLNATRNNAINHQIVAPKRSGIDWLAHQTLAEELFHKALEQSQRFRAGYIQKLPQILVALDAQNHLVGASIANLERTLVNNKRLYTPLPHGLTSPQIQSQTLSTHGSINWLTSLNPQKGVGTLLVSAIESLLSKTFTTIDLVSNVPEISEPAVPLYQKFGFVPLTSEQESYPIPLIPNKVQAKRYTFQEMKGLPMSAKRKTMTHRAESERTRLGYQPIPDSPDIDLNTLVQATSA